MEVSVVDTSTSKISFYRVNAKDTVASLKRNIGDETGIKTIIKFKNRRLRNSEHMAICEVCNNDQIQVEWIMITVFVREEKFTVRLDAVVDELKELVRMAFRIEDLFGLKFGDQLLCSTRSLRTYGIRNGDVLDVSQLEYRFDIIARHASSKMFHQMICYTGMTVTDMIQQIRRKTYLKGCIRLVFQGQILQQDLDINECGITAGCSLLFDECGLQNHDRSLSVMVQYEQQIQRFLVNMDATIGELREYVRHYFGLSSTAFSLMHCGELLCDTDFLVECAIADGHILDVGPACNDSASIDIIIMDTVGRRHVVDCLLEMTVSDMANRVQRKVGPFVNGYRLLLAFEGKCLRPEERIRDSGIQAGSTVSVISVVPDGSCSPITVCVQCGHELERFTVSPDATVSLLQRCVRTMWPPIETSITLRHRGRFLRPENAIRAYGIISGDELIVHNSVYSHLLPASFDVVVKADGRIGHHRMACCGNMAIACLVVKAITIIGLPEGHRWQLLFNGVVLPMNSRIDDCGISYGDILQLTIVSTPQSNPSGRLHKMFVIVLNEISASSFATFTDATVYQLASCVRRVFNLDQPFQLQHCGRLLNDTDVLNECGIVNGDLLVVSNAQCRFFVRVTDMLDGYQCDIVCHPKVSVSDLFKAIENEMGLTDDRRFALMIITGKVLPEDGRIDDYDVECGEEIRLVSV